MSKGTADQLKTAIKDIRRTVCGIGSLIKYCFEKDDISLALSLFSANSSSIRAGNTYTYDVIIINNTAQDIRARLLFDIYLKNKPVHPEGHFAYYVKNIFIRSHQSSSAVISYNWNDCLKFTIDGHITDPDNVWRGVCSSKGAYLIQAALLDEHGTCLDKLTIAQQLS